MKKMERWEFVYDQLNGNFEPAELDGVREEVSEGGALAPFVERAYGARDRLCERTGLSDHSDPDLEEMISAFEGLCRTCGRLMYRYGLRDGRAGRDAAE